MGIQLGEVVKDQVTGISGTVTARCVYLFSEPSCLVEYVVEGKPQETWFAERRLNLTA